MFTFGIFTTHIPYLAFVVFYAFFLVFGEKKTSEITICNHSHQIQIEQQTESLCHSIEHSYHAHKQAFDSQPQDVNFSFEESRHKRSITYINSLFVQSHILENPFNRPPPTIEFKV